MYRSGRNKGFIYAIINKSTGGVYIGSSENTRTRWGRHRQQLSGGSHHCKALQGAWAISGASNFEFLILEHIATDFGNIRLIRERHWFDTYSHTAPHVYNSRPIAPKPANKIATTEDGIKVLIAMPPETYEAVKVEAEKDLRSWRAEIIVLIREALTARASK